MITGNSNNGYMLGGYACMRCGCWVYRGTYHGCFGPELRQRPPTITVTGIELTEDDRAKLSFLEARVADLERRLKAAIDALGGRAA